MDLGLYVDGVAGGIKGYQLSLCQSIAVQFLFWLFSGMPAVQLDFQERCSDLW